MSSSMPGMTGLFKLLGKAAGKKMGKVVQSDVKLAGKVPNWGHAEKIKELADDSGLSPSYLKDLIINSKKEGDVEKVIHYLSDAEKTANMNSATRNELLSLGKEKFETLTDAAVLKGFIELLKEHGTDWLH